MDHFYSWVIALPLLLIVGPPRHAIPQIAPPDDTGHHISVNVNLVVLHATVRNRAGHFVSGLKQRDFAVYEDGTLQTLRLFRHEDIPVTVGLVIDHSGSMQAKLAQVITAARTFVQASNPEDEVFIVNFNEKVTLGLPASMPFTNQLPELESAIRKTPATGQTALYDAVAQGLERLQSGTRDKKVLIVISDGGDNASRTKLDRVLEMADKSSALIYTIGIFDETDPDRNPGVLKRLAQQSGGEAFIPDEFHSLDGVCERIARDIRHQYTLGFASTSESETAAYRKIRVTAAAQGVGKLSVRTRAGYIPAAKAQ